MPTVEQRLEWFLAMHKKEYPRASYLTEDLHFKLYALGSNTITKEALVNVLVSCGNINHFDNNPDVAPLRYETKSGAQEIVDEFCQGYETVDGACLVKVFLLQFIRVELFKTLRYLRFKFGDSIQQNVVMMHICAAAGKYQGSKIMDHLIDDKHTRAPISVRDIGEFYFKFDQMLSEKAVKGGCLANINFNEELLAAVKDQHVSQVKALLNSPTCDPNAVFPSNDQHVLHAAIGYDNRALVNVLLAGKADVNAKNVEGLSCLVTSLEDPNFAIISTLLEAKADCSAVNGDGSPVLHMALATHDDTIVHHLLLHGADPKQQDKEGKDAKTVAIQLELGQNIIDELVAKS